MIINSEGAAYLYEGNLYRIGARVYANNESDYGGLYGRVFEICDGEDKQTDNDGPDFFCAFDEPTDPAFRNQLEDRFSQLYGYPKTIEDLALDCVIMAWDMIDLLPDGEKEGAICD